MMTYRKRKRPIKRAIQLAFKKKREFNSNAIVLGGYDLEFQLELYNGQILSAEQNLTTWSQQLAAAMAKNRLVYPFYGDISKLLKIYDISQYSILDRDFTSCLLTSRGDNYHHTIKDIELFLEKTDNPRYIILTFSAGPRGIGYYLRDKYGANYYLYSKRYKRGQFILDTISSIKRIAKMYNLKIQEYMIYEALSLAAKSNSYYNYISGFHIYRDVNYGTESYMVTCQLKVL